MKNPMPEISTPEDPPADRPNRIPWPPLLDLATLAAAYALERWVPINALPRGLVVQGAGVVLIVAGLAIAAAAILTFRAARTTVDPTGHAAKLVTHGIFRFTRNPMYLGTLVLFAGVGLAADWAWLVLLLPVLATLLFILAIRREEGWLERRFGGDYRDYKQRVRRWI